MSSCGLLLEIWYERMYFGLITKQIRPDNTVVGEMAVGLDPGTLAFHSHVLTTAAPFLLWVYYWIGFISVRYLEYHVPGVL